jgi:hypothetical protein
MIRKGLEIAASVLDDVAAERPHEKMRVLTGAAALAKYLILHPDQSNFSILDAQEALHRLAVGRNLSLNLAGRRRAGYLADCVRLLAEDAVCRDHMSQANLESA